MPPIGQCVGSFTVTHEDCLQFLVDFIVIVTCHKCFHTSGGKGDIYSIIIPIVDVLIERGMQPCVEHTVRKRCKYVER